jgi:hypothetical protein
MGQYKQQFFYDLDTGSLVRGENDNRDPQLRRWVAGDTFLLSIGFLRDGTNVTETLLENGSAFVRAQVKASLGEGEAILASGSGYTVANDLLTFRLSLNTAPLKAAVNAVTGDTALLFFILETESSDETDLAEWIQLEVPVNKEGITSEGPVDPAQPGYWDKVESDARYFNQSGTITEATPTNDEYEIDFDSGAIYTRLTVDDDVDLTTAGREAGIVKRQYIEIINTDTNDHTLTTEAWLWLGGPPLLIPGPGSLFIEIFSTGADVGDIRAAAAIGE